MKLIIAGGGTGGHLFPGIAVAEEFLARDKKNEVLFVGTERGIEARAVPAAGYQLATINASGIRGKGTFSKISGAIQMLYGYSQSRKILKSFRPDFLLGVGGYASLPMLLAGKGMEIPIFIHEQNAIPGLTNRLLARFAKKIFLTLEESQSYFPKDKSLLTGNPLRKQILDLISAEKRDDSINDDTKPFNLFIFGGSQGASAINSAIINILPKLKNSGIEFKITHQTGEKDYQNTLSSYEKAGVTAEVTPFISNMAQKYAEADLIICRAGATTIAEITACGRTALFIPFPYAVDDHQRKNGEALLKKDACHLLLEAELKPEKLLEIIIESATNRDKCREIGRRAFELAKLDAAEVIVGELIDESKKTVSHE